MMVRSVARSLDYAFRLKREAGREMSHGILKTNVSFCASIPLPQIVQGSGFDP